MSEQQFLLGLIAPITTIAVVLVGFLFNNSRITDLASRFDGRFTDLSNRFDGRFTDLSSRVDGRLGDLKDIIKAEAESSNANLRRMEEMMLGKFAEVDNRLNRIESYLKIH